MRTLLSALSSYLFLIVAFVLFQCSQASPTWPNDTNRKRDSSAGTPPPSTVEALLAQLRNPAEVLTVLLLIGGDVVQKAIAQVCGRAFTPVSFSFGWVGYAFSALMSVFGDGLIMPESDIAAKVIDVGSGNVQDNESWVLGRLVRDMELEVERYYPTTMGKPPPPNDGQENYKELKGLEKKPKLDQRLQESPLIITKWEAINHEREVRGKPFPQPNLPHRDYIWWSYISVAITQVSPPSQRNVPSLILFREYRMHISLLPEHAALLVKMYERSMLTLRSWGSACHCCRSNV
jgi:large-conductance mechanosensitive channel